MSHFLRPPRYFETGKNLLDVAALQKDIKEGKEHGFVTIKGGKEMGGRRTEASDHFGFCVQSHACTSDKEISSFT